jgi:tetratricopeptide (TPR) repeat protein
MAGIRLVGPSLAAVVLAIALTGCKSAEERWAHHMAAGREQIAQKDYKRAVLSFQNAVKAKPHDADSYYELAMAQVGAGDGAAGVASLRKVLELDPKHTNATLRLAELMISTADRARLEKAEQQLRNLVAAKPDSVEALTTLAIAEWKLAKPEDAEAHLLQAFQQAPAHLTSSVALAKIRIQRRDFQGAEQILRSAAAQRVRSADSLVALAEFLLFRNRNHEAEEQINDALRINPKHAIALLHLGAIYVQRGQFDRAEEIYRRTASLPDKRYRPVHAIFLLQRGRRDEATEQLRALVQRDPLDRTSRSALVVSHMQAGRTTDAEAVLTDALKANPKDGEALLQRAGLLLSRGKTDDAFRDINLFLQFRSDSPEAHYLLSKVHEQRSSPYNQRQALSEALRLRADFLEARLELAMLLIRSNAARPSLQVLDEAPKHQKRLPILLTQRNWALLALGLHAEVRQNVDAMLASSLNTDILLQDALLKLSLNRTAAARQAVQKILEKDPTDIRGLELLAKTYESDNQVQAGLKAVESYVGRVPDASRAQHLLGTLLLKHGRLGEAKRAFHAAKSGSSPYPMAELSLARVDLEELKWQEARARLTNFIAEHGEQATAREWLGKIEQRLGNTSAAMAHYRELLNADPNHIVGLNNLAFLLAGVGKTDEALKYAERARELAPTNAAVEDTLGWVLYRKGLYTMALRHLESAVKREATPRRRCHLGMAYVKAGDPQRGRQLIQVAIEADPAIPEANDARTLITRM